MFLMVDHARRQHGKAQTNDFILIDETKKYKIYPDHLHDADLCPNKIHLRLLFVGRIVRENQKLCPEG